MAFRFGRFNIKLINSQIHRLTTEKTKQCTAKMGCKGNNLFWTDNGSDPGKKSFPFYNYECTISI